MGFYRKIETKLYSYYKDQDAKILIINGARQIGKSFIIRETARKAFNNYIEINLKDDFDGDGLFKSIKTADDFYLQISALYGAKLGNINDTIVFLDEIQVYPHLLSLLKALKQDNRYRYICSGSLLGLTMRHTFIPMGSVEEIQMYPMDFEEFLLAEGVGKEVIEYLRECYVDVKDVSENIHITMLRKFKEYLICGGLPDSVKAFVVDKNIARVRDNQKTTLSYYKDDASQYDEKYNLIVRRVYDSLPSYMSYKVKRIVFNNIENKKQKDYYEYQDEFDYLIYSGCTLPTKAVSNPSFPLDESKSKNLLKLYYNDVGILSGILYQNNTQAITQVDSGINLGSVYETAVAMELIAHEHNLYYFDSKKVGEVDFLINDYDGLSVVPIEVKSGKDQYNFRALPKLIDKDGNYKLKKGIVFGNKNITRKEDNLYIYPIYQVMFV